MMEVCSPHVQEALAERERQLEALERKVGKSLDAAARQEAASKRLREQEAQAMD